MVIPFVPAAPLTTIGDRAHFGDIPHLRQHLHLLPDLPTGCSLYYDESRFYLVLVLDGFGKPITLGTARGVSVEEALGAISWARLICDLGRVVRAIVDTMNDNYAVQDSGLAGAPSCKICAYWRLDGSEPRVHADFYWMGGGSNWNSRPLFDITPTSILFTNHHISLHNPHSIARSAELLSSIINYTIRARHRSGTSWANYRSAFWQQQWTHRDRGVSDVR